MIKALALVEDKVEEAGTGFGERVTSLSMVPSKKGVTLFEGKEITEADFFNELEAELKKVDDFTDNEVQSIKKKMSATENQCEEFIESTKSHSPDDDNDKEKETREKIRNEAKKIGDEFLRIEKFANLNFLATHKILKKHDKNLPIPCRRFYITRLHDQRWVKHDYSKLFVRLSKMHAKLRGDTNNEADNSAGQAFVRTTTKYWVRTADISKVKHKVLQHLPVFQYDLDNLSGDSQLANSVYFDNEQLELYHGRLDKTPQAIAIRFRWYATQEPHLVFIERKTHRDSWTGEISVKERFTLKEHQVLPFLDGKYTVDDKIKEMEKKNATQKEKDYVRQLFNEIYQQIDSKQLRPTMRTQYNRVAYQIPFNQTVRISLDTNLAMLAENPKVGPSCATANRWYRDPKLILPNTEVTRFPHAVLEVKLALKEGEDPPQWVTDLINSGLCTEVHKFSKFIHGCATLLYDQVRSLPYWIDDASIRPSILRSQPLPVGTKKRVGADDMNNLDKNQDAITPELKSGGVASELQNNATLNLMERKLSVGDSPKYGSTGFNQSDPLIQQKQQYISTSYAATNDPFYDNSEQYQGKPPLFQRMYNQYLGGGGNGYSTISQNQVVKPRKIPMKIEPKVFFANERTFISYLSMSTTLGGIAAALLGLSVDNPTISTDAAVGSTLVGMLLLPVAIVYVIYATITFRWRLTNLYLRSNSQGFHDTVGPTVLGIILAMALSAVFILHLFEGISVKV